MAHADLVKEPGFEIIRQTQAGLLADDGPQKCGAGAVVHVGGARLVVGAVGDHGHAEGLAHSAQAGADAAVADDADGLAADLKALAVGLLFPEAAPHGVAGVGDEAGAGEHVGQGKLGHALGRGARGVLHGHALGFGIGNVDVVHANAAADDELQAAFGGLVDMIGAHLGLGAHDHRVKVLQRGAQRIGLIELLDDLVAHLAQRGQRLLIHSVGNQNLHSKNPPLF